MGDTFRFMKEQVKEKEMTTVIHVESSGLLTVGATASERQRVLAKPRQEWLGDSPHVHVVVISVIRHKEFITVFARWINSVQSVLLFPKIMFCACPCVVGITSA